MLRIEHLTKNYGEKKAVDGLNLHIAPGEIYGFIGHNGAGKTTTLKSVARILQFDAGEIYIDGKSIRTQPLECKRSFAYTIPVRCRAAGIHPNGLDSRFSPTGFPKRRIHHEESNLNSAGCGNAS